MKLGISLRRFCSTTVFDLRRVTTTAIGLSVLVVLSTGCAFTRTTVAVQVSATASKPLDQSPTAKLVVGQVEDSRPVSDKLVLTQKYNGYGQRTSGAYIAKEPVADIFKQGLEKVLENNRFTKATNQTTLEITAKIQEFDHDVITGFWTATVKPKLSVRFELFDKSSGASVWHDTFVGRATLETAWGTGAFLVQTFDKACDDVYLQLISDNSFRALMVNPTPRP